MPLDAGGFPLGGTPVVQAIDGSVSLTADAGPQISPLGSGSNPRLNLSYTVGPAAGTAIGDLVVMRVDSSKAQNSYNLLSLFTSTSVTTPRLFIDSTGALTSASSITASSNLTGTVLNLSDDAAQIRIGGSSDVRLVRGGAAATLQHGDANAASPVAQIVQAQGSRSGTDTNIGGANFTVRSGNGTGTGTLSSLILQSPVAVASGTGAQTQTTGLTIKEGTAIFASYTTAGLPVTATTGAMVYNTTTAALNVYNGSAWVAVGAAASTYLPTQNLSANYTTVAGDAGGNLVHPASDGSPRTFTIAANASVPYTIGTTITFTNYSAGALSIAITSDTLRLAGGTNSGTRTLTRYGVCTALKIDTTEWIISGTTVT